MEFMAVEPVSVPKAVETSVFSLIDEALHPSPLKVFVRVALIQFVVGSFTLLFCPQFGVSFLSSHGIMPFLMQFGESVCMLGCGAIFTSLSLLLVSFLLRPEEIRSLRRHEVLHLFSLSTLSLGALLCLGGEIVFTLGLVWLLGAMIGGAATLELGWFIRRKIAQGAAA